MKEFGKIVAEVVFTVLVVYAASQQRIIDKIVAVLWVVCPVAIVLAIICELASWVRQNI